MLREKPSYANAGLRIDPVTPDDLPSFVEMFGELVEFMRAAEWFSATQDDFHRALFDDPQRMEAIIVRYEGEPAGLATWFETYEALSGKVTMWFDYLYVRPAFRSKPIAPAMLIYLLMLAKDRDYLWIEGTVQAWNAEALSFYKTVRAQELPHHIHRLHLSRIDWTLLEKLRPKGERK